PRVRAAVEVHARAVLVTRPGGLVIGTRIPAERINGGQIDLPGPGPLIVDAVGLLSTLYPVADVAYVGGGFGPGGLHSVIEPAAAGLPVLFARGRSRAEARGLRAAGAAFSLDPSSAASAVAGLIEDERLRERMGTRGREYVERGAGGAVAGAEILHALLGTSAVSS
ncbi:MAG: hypothetical protein ACE5HQ_11280, partial [Gemmatimonadota bacterium]